MKQQTRKRRRIPQEVRERAYYRNQPTTTTHDDDDGDGYADDYARQQAKKEYNKEINELHGKLYRRKREKAKINFVKKDWQWPKWTYIVRKTMKKKRISKILRPIYKELRDNCLTYNDCKALTYKKGLPFYEHEMPEGQLIHVLSVIDTYALADKYGVSLMAVHRQIEKWCSGPLIKLGMDGPKNQGGKLIVAMGYWPHRFRRIFFFTEKNWQDWWKNILYETG